MNHLPKPERLKIAKFHEDRAFIFAQEKPPHGPGMNLRRATTKDDMDGKTDCFEIIENEKEDDCRIAIKDRLDNRGFLSINKDILVDLFDPFYGFDHGETQIGRDIIFVYRRYIATKSGEFRVCCGKKIHKIAMDLIEEYKTRYGNYKFSRNRGLKVVMYSYVYAGCQIQSHFDARSGEPKLLAFICPDFLEQGTEIITYPYFDK